MAELVSTSEGFCAHTASIFQLLGTLLLIFKILIPVILIILCMIDLGRAVISSEDKQVKKSISTIVKRFILAVVIYFIPLIITVIFSFIEEFNKNKPDFNVCKTCLIDPNGTNENNTGCADYIKKYGE